MAYYNYYPQYPYNMYQQSYSTGNFKSMEWVEGEVGAKAFQMPQGWPADTPIVLWDSTEKKIFLKSWNAMGMANPLQELDYEIKERTNPALLPNNLSGDTANYVTKEDFDHLRQELKEMKNILSNRNNRGGGNQ